MSGTVHNIIFSIPQSRVSTTMHQRTFSIRNTTRVNLAIPILQIGYVGKDNVVNITHGSTQTGVQFVVCFYAQLTVHGELSLLWVFSSARHKMRGYLLSSSQISNIMRIDKWYTVDMIQELYTVGRDNKNGLRKVDLKAVVVWCDVCLCVREVEWEKWIRRDVWWERLLCVGGGEWGRFSGRWTIVWGTWRA